MTEYSFQCVERTSWKV